ncbi:MAG TPA: tripartite tricarboxylate transporter substrate binding protein [Burkholderiales bacterium]|nr:tripartite tricarboxylate transporter substrate binding protein [Burkholderiales bacterium]
MQSLVVCALRSTPLVVLASWIAGVQAQDYPGKPIRWVIPYASGGAADITARIMAPRMTESLGQQIVVDNRPGGATIPAVDAVAKSAPDGYTWLIANIAFGANPSLFRKLPYDPIRDFVEVSQLAVVPMVLVVHPSVPVRSPQELITLAKAKPGALNYGSAGNGGANHLATEVFRSMSGIDIVHVPYKAIGQALSDLLGGQISMLFGTVTSVHPYIKSGRLKALCISNIRPNPALPEVAPCSERGVAGYNVNEWQVLVVPGRTPPGVVERLHKEVVKALADPDVKNRLAGLGAEPVGSSPREAADFVRSELARWAKIVKEAGIQPVD